MPPLIRAERVALQQVLILAVDALHLRTDRVERALVRERPDVVERQNEDGVLLEMLAGRRVVQTARSWNGGERSSPRFPRKYARVWTLRVLSKRRGRGSGWKDVC
ncbi:hypothetical protein WMF45_09025 [Sorangium sp. So ce448]|uniref:hypothetical protein n=1 Tax=Sorangium sp. So ce448 TaxID=3133314 RepID=UPI003F613FDC